MTTNLIPFNPSFIDEHAQLALPPDMSMPDWEEAGEFLAFLDQWTPWALGDWYLFGKAHYGAGATIARLAAIRIERPECRLAHLSTKTLQNYATVCKTFPTSGMRFYNFWHCEAVGSVPEEGRLYLLEAGKNEEMGVAQFRRFVAEEMHKQAKEAQAELAPGNLVDHAAALEATNGRIKAHVEEVEITNRALGDAVEFYAEQLAARDALIAQIKAQAAARQLDEPNAGARIAYERDTAGEWQTGRCACGGRLVCERCGEVQS